MASLEVFIAEDEPPIAEMIASMVDESPAGFRTAFVAHDGRSMLDRLAANRPDLLLADIRMPVMGGLDLIQAARKLHPDLPCVVITSHPDFEYARAALRAGAMDYVLKTCLPESLDEVLLRVRRSLGLEGLADGPDARMDTGARLKEHLDGIVRSPFDLREVAEVVGLQSPVPVPGLQGPRRCLPQALPHEGKDRSCHRHAQEGSPAPPQGGRFHHSFR